MFTKRIAALVVPATLAGGVLLAAAPASAATGPLIGTRVAAGYQDSGRDFRYIQSLLTIPDQTSFQSLYPQEYIELSNGSALTGLGSNSGDQYIRVGVETCLVALADHAIPFEAPCNPATTPWVAFADYFTNTLGGSFTAKYFTLGGGVSNGEGVKVAIYYNVPGNSLQITVTPPTPAGGAPVPGVTYTAPANGAIFDHASALDDFTSSLGGAPVSLPPFIGQFELNSFLEGAVTTQSGLRGSFTSTGWTTSEVEATSNGDPAPLGTVRVDPDALYGDGASANGAVRPQDAFDIYAR